MAFPSAKLQAYYCKNTMDVKGVKLTVMNSHPCWMMKYLKVSNHYLKCMAGNYLL